MAVVTLEDTEKALEVVARVERTVLRIARVALDRINGAESALKEIDEKMPDASLEALATGDRARVMSLYRKRESIERTTAEARIAWPAIKRFYRQTQNQKGRLKGGKFEFLPKGEPATWWPAYLIQDLPTSGEDMDDSEVRMLLSQQDSTFQGAVIPAHLVEG